MPDEIRDGISNFISTGSNILLLDAPRRTVNSTLFGLFLYVVFLIIKQLLESAINLEVYHFVIVGVFSTNARTIWNIMKGTPTVSETYEEKFEIVRRAELAGLSKLHVKLQLLEICRLALNDAALKDAVKNQLSEIKNDN